MPGEPRPGEAALMRPLDPWSTALAGSLSPFGSLLAVYVRQGRDLVPWGPPGRRRLRPLAGSSALARTLHDLPGPILGPGADTALGRAVLQELQADAALLVRAQGHLVAVATLGCDEAHREDLEAALPDIAVRAQESWPQVATEAASPRGPSDRSQSDSWFRRIGARLFGPGPA